MLYKRSANNLGITGYFDADNSEEARHNAREAWAAARMSDLENDLQNDQNQK